MPSGKIKSWNDNKGFGFITVGPNQKDIFAHISAFPSYERSPRVGDLVTYQVELQSDGKKRATLCSIDGLSLAPQKRRTSVPRKSKPRTSGIFGWLRLGIIAAGLAGAYFYQGSHQAVTNDFQEQPLMDNVAVEQNFVCDGRQHCSQMTSFEEAVFFNNSCPDTKMDGDRDGIPCERQFGR